MDAYIIRAINEHKELTDRINKLASFIEAIKLDMIKGETKIDVEDYTLMRIQLEHMINYHDALESRLNKHGIVVDGERYYEDVTGVKLIQVPPTNPDAPGSDFDLDEQRKNE